MATWTQLEREASEVAEVATRLWPGPVALHRNGSLPEGASWFAVGYLGTVRRDGGPRVHPFCPILADGRLFAAIPRSSPKGWDLRRDPRCVIHALPGADDDELCIRALAREVSSDESLRAAIGAVIARTGVGGMIESVAHDPLFEFDLRQVDVARWVDIGQPGTHAVRRQWRATQRPSGSARMWATEQHGILQREPRPHNSASGSADHGESRRRAYPPYPLRSLAPEPAMRAPCLWCARDRPAPLILPGALSPLTWGNEGAGIV